MLVKLPISLSFGRDERTDVPDFMDFLVLLTVGFASRLLIHRDRSIGKQAEATAMHGSTEVHIPASTNDPVDVRTFCAR